MGRAQRRKGHDFERKIAREMRKVFPSAKRGFQTRGGGKEEPDIDDTPFHIECKTGKRPNIRAALGQAFDDSTNAARSELSAKFPVAICHWDRAETIVAMYMDDWLRLVKEWAR